MKAGTWVAGALLASTAAVGFVMDVRTETNVRRVEIATAVATHSHVRLVAQSSAEDPEQEAKRTPGPTTRSQEYGTIKIASAASADLLPVFHAQDVTTTLGVVLDSHYVTRSSFSGLFHASPRTQKPDDLTAHYLTAMADRWNSLNGSSDRIELMERIGRVHRDYVQRTGDTQFVDWLGAAMRRATAMTEQDHIIAAIATVPGPAQAQLIFSWTEHAQASVRRRAVSLLIRVQGRDRSFARDRILIALRDEDAGVRSAATAVFPSVFRGLDGASKLATALSVEPQPDVAAKLAKAIVQMDKTNGKTTVRDAVRRSPDAIQKSVAKALR